LTRIRRFLIRVQRETLVGGGRRGAAVEEGLAGGQHSLMVGHLAALFQGVSEAAGQLPRRVVVRDQLEAAAGRRPRFVDRLFGRSGSGRRSLDRNAVLLRLVTVHVDMTFQVELGREALAAGVTVVDGLGAACVPLLPVVVVVVEAAVAAAAAEAAVGLTHRHRGLDLSEAGQHNRPHVLLLLLVLLLLMLVVIMMVRVSGEGGQVGAEAEALAHILVHHLHAGE